MTACDNAAMETTRWLTDKEQRVWRLTRDFQQLMDLAIDRQLQQIASMSSADYAVLVCLSEGDPAGLRAREVGSQLGWDRSRVSHQVRRMAARGLVIKDTCADDGRGTIVRITDQGMREIQAAAPPHVEKVRELYIDHLSAEEVGILTDIFARVVRRVEEVDGITLPK